MVTETLAGLGFKPYSLSERVREEARGRRLVIERDTLIAIGNELRFEEPIILARRTAELILADKPVHAVIEGIRNPAELIYLRKNLGAIIVAVDANEQIRLARFLSRQRTDDPKTEADFWRINAIDLGRGEAVTGQQVAECIMMADIHLTNEGTPADLVKACQILIDSLSQ